MHWRIGKNTRQCVLPAVAAVLLAVSALAQPLPGQWMVDPRNGCRIWDPMPVPDEVMQWDGACVDGIGQGPGTAILILGGKEVARVTGTLTAGKLSGRAVIIDSVGNRSEGEMLDGAFDGKVVTQQADGIRVERVYARGKAAEHAVSVFPGGVRFEGTMGADGLPRVGTMTWPDGERYDGEWKSGLPNGVGTLRRPGLEPFSGEWSNGCFRDGGRRAAVIVTRAQCGFR